MWDCIHEDTEDERIHTMPLDDDIIHLEGMQCPCRPTLRMIPVYDPLRCAMRGQVQHQWVGDGEQ